MILGAKPSQYFKNRDFYASAKVPVAFPLKISLRENETTVNLKSDSYVVIMLLHEGLTDIFNNK